MLSGNVVETGEHRNQADGGMDPAEEGEGERSLPLGNPY
jgi:hypothetical protein